MPYTAPPLFRSALDRLCVAALVLMAAAPPLLAQAEPEPAPEPDQPEVPAAEQIERSAVVDRLLDDPLVTEDERRRLQVFHGRWDDLPDAAELPLDLRAGLALLRYELDADVLRDAQADPLLRARAALLRGEPAAALEALQGEASAQAALLRAEAHEQSGQPDQAIAELTPWRQTAQHDAASLTDAAELTAVAQGLAVLARLEGRPAQDYQLAMNLLGEAHQSLDPLYWPARLAEAELLIQKDNAGEAVEALLEALSLNPRSGAAWYQLGRLAARGFDFDRAAAALDELRRTNEHHLLADLLETHMRLTQRDVDAARKAVTAALERYPHQRELIALLAATEALAYHEQAMRAALDRLDELAPGNPVGPFTVGVYLSLARQYEEGEAMLREAIARQPNAAAPRIELGLLLMQAGDDEAARQALAAAVRLDPFNRRANNQLKLVEQLLGYAVIETDHFLIRYRPGVDAVLARDMPEALETIYRDVTAAFAHRPERKTQIDIMPDEEWFGVRITGMPEIWTIGASTGDVIAITPPRTGARQRGTFDWHNVIRHEYVHTVTLSRTHNRLPHWFTEACAVSQELTDRGYDTCQLLAWALHNDELFALDQINWGFIRPKTPRDRPLAYAQAHWMLEYITAAHGHDAVLDLLGRYSAGEGDVAALAAVTGRDADAFMAAFKAWAHEQVAQWGLALPEAPRVRAIATGETTNVDDEQLAALLASHPDQPDLLRIAAERTLAAQDAEAARRAVLRYAAARPVDPWPHRELLKLALRSGRPAEAIASLEQLDHQETQHGDWAHQLAKIYRAQGQLDAAADAARRSLRREPYNATYRELAATIALQRGDTDAALRHLEAMPLLEPERAIHHVRLAALYAQLHRPDDARAAAEQARAIDPDAPVERFIQGDR